MRHKVIKYVQGDPTPSDERSLYIKGRIDASVPPAGNQYLRDSGPVSNGFSTADWTIAVWLRLNDLTNFQQMFRFRRVAHGTQNQVEISHPSPGQLRVKVYDDNDATKWRSEDYNSFFVENTWVHMILFWQDDIDSIDVWKNAVQQSADDASNGSGGVPDSNDLDTDIEIDIGGVTDDSGTASSPMDGHLYSVAVWDESLGGSEKSAIYNGGDGRFDLSTDSGGYTSSANLTHWWRVGYDPNNIGTDYGSLTSDIFNPDSNGISRGDLVPDYPGA